MSSVIPHILVEGPILRSINLRSELPLPLEFVRDVDGFACLSSFAALLSLRAFKLLYIKPTLPAPLLIPIRTRPPNGGPRFRRPIILVVSEG